MSETTGFLEQATHRTSGRSGAIETTATILIAIGAVFTAWAAFQHAKWSGTQASDFRQAAAAGTAAAQATTVASLDQNVDASSFLQWMQAVRDDVDRGLVDPTGPYVIKPETLSGFIALRFRDEFKAAFNAWLAYRPLTNPAAPPTPFALPEYSLAAKGDADRMNDAARSSGDAAQSAIHNAENYALMTVLFAVALVMASVGAKVSPKNLAWLTLDAALIILLIAGVVMATFPVEL